MLGAVAAMLGGGIALRRYGQRVLGNLLLAVLAAPGLVYFLFVLLILVLQPDFR